MTVTNVLKDKEALTMTIEAEFDAPVDRVWRLWEDPRQLERWWGPPTYPATVVEHDLTEGGTVTYYMTGPEGDKPRGWWRILAVEPPHRLEFEDGFADDEGNPVDTMPSMIIRVAISDQGQGRSAMRVQTTFPSIEAMEELIAMGMEEGATGAFGQIDEVLRSEGAAA